MTDPNLSNVVALAQQLGPALQAGDRTTLNDIIAQLVDLRAPMGEQWQQLAQIAAGNGELGLARKAIDRFVEALGGSAVARFHKAAFLSMIGAHGEADALLQTIPDRVPDPLTHAFSRGSSALSCGQPDDARRWLEAVTRARPQSGRAWHLLSLSADLARESDLADRMTAAGRAMDTALPLERAAYDYALGKLHADRGEHRPAFATFARGAGRMKAMAPYDRAADRAGAERAVQGYSPARIAAIAETQSEPSARTIFVTGLPRSGTTLVEQILTSHSAVADGGEIGRLFLLAQEIGDVAHAGLVRFVDAKGAPAAARLWAHWLDELFPAPGHIVDKTVDSSRFLGLAAALLPEAKILWITRDPLDRAWSCLRTLFGGNSMPWSYDQGDIAAHVRLEDRLLTQWRQILGNRLMVLAYEDLVTDPDQWIRHILAHCNLAEEPGVFAPHENRRPVPTASMMQVRRPINRGGIGAATPYREHLDDFLRAYEA